MNPVSSEPSPKNVHVSDLDGLRHDKNLEGKPDATFYLAHDFRKVNNPHLHHPDLYPISKTKSGVHLYTPQINNITNVMPPSPPLLNDDNIPKVGILTLKG
jgi:hypothetical protein